MPTLTFTNNVHTSGTDFSLRILNAPNAIIVNNTFWGTGLSEGSGLDISAGSNNAIVVNNILRVMTVRPGVTLSSTRGNNLINTIYEIPRIAGELSGTPLFVNYAGGDLHLLSGSLGINQGIAAAFVPALDFDGLARVGVPDMGAYEFQS